MRKNLSIEREFEREILDHAAFLRDEEEAARLEYEVEAEYGQDWEEDLLETYNIITPEDADFGLVSMIAVRGVGWVRV